MYIYYNFNNKRKNGVLNIYKGVNKKMCKQQLHTK